MPSCMHKSSTNDLNHSTQMFRAPPVHVGFSVFFSFAAVVLMQAKGLFDPNTILYDCPPSKHSNLSLILVGVMKLHR